MKQSRGSSADRRKVKSRRSRSLESEILSEKSGKSSRKSSTEGSVDKKSLLGHDDESEEHKTGCSQKFKLCLRFISLGKYQTPLFFQKSQSYSSMGGGLITIFFILFMTYLSVTISISIFQKEKYILDQKSLKFQKFEVFKAPDNITNTVRLDPHCIGDCPIITNGELLKDLFNNQTLYGVVRDRNVSLQKPCSEFSLQLQFLTLINQSDTHYLSINISSKQETANICLFSFNNIQDDLFKNDKLYLLQEPAFIERQLKDKIVSRFRLIFRGLNQKQETVVSIHQNHIVSNSEVHSTREISLEYPVDKVIFEKLEIVKYSGYESVVLGKLGTPSTQLEFLNFLGHNEGILDQVPNDGSIEVYFAFTDYFTSYEKYPDTIFSGLAKIGGLFAALKISLILLFTNSYLFKRKLIMRQPSPDSQDDEKIVKKSFQPFSNSSIEEKYSIENFERLLHNVEKQEMCIKKLKRRYAQMEKKIESITNQQNFSIQRVEERSLVGKYKKKNTLKEF